MLMVTCWLIIHSSYVTDKMDYRSVVNFRGKFIKDKSDNRIMVDFSEDFERKNINLEFNTPVQYVLENDCLYEKSK